MRAPEHSESMKRPMRATRFNSTCGLWRRIHGDEWGAVSIETMLIIGAIALPILIFLLKFGWPRIRDYFRIGMDHMEIEADRTKHGG
jgi:hypothetical protein